MKKTCDYNICTGCGVCSTVCPKDCISFIEEGLGHIYPKINQAICIDCKQCEQVCPALKNIDKQMPSTAYAAVIKDEQDYITTTSGGAAQALSLHTLNHGGIVYGCASLPGANVEHIRIDNRKSLELLKGSKYVQSTLWKIYPQLMQDVKSAIKVLFIGTPCQCAAVKSLYKNLPDNLCLVELICHGVPSQKFLHEYLVKQGCKLKDIDRLWFRTSRGFQVVASKKSQLGDYKPIYESIPLWDKDCKDFYYHTFFYGYSYRPSCYTCQFACPRRCGDITIGDFWKLGAELPTKEIPAHPHGISVILPCTSKGYDKIQQIAELISLYERPVEEAISGNHQLQHPTSCGLDVKIFNILRPILGISNSFKLSFFMRRGFGFIRRKLKLA